MPGREARVRFGQRAAVIHVREFRDADTLLGDDDAGPTPCPFLQTFADGSCDRSGLRRQFLGGFAGTYEGSGNVIGNLLQKRSPVFRRTADNGDLGCGKCDGRGRPEEHPCDQQGHQPSKRQGRRFVEVTNPMLEFCRSAVKVVTRLRFQRFTRARDHAASRGARERG